MVKCDDNFCEYISKGETTEMEMKDVFAYSEEAEKGLEDMVDLDKLNNASLLLNLLSRYNYKERNIYTYVSPTLLVVNPFQPVTHLMSPQFFTECQQVIYIYIYIYIYMYSLRRIQS